MGAAIRVASSKVKAIVVALGSSPLKKVLAAMKQGYEEKIAGYTEKVAALRAKLVDSSSISLEEAKKCGAEIYSIFSDKSFCDSPNVKAEPRAKEICDEAENLWRRSSD